LFDEKETDELRSSTDLRFPPVEEIKKIYTAIINYLQIPPGSGAFEYYDFDLPDFVKKFRLNSFAIANGLKTLEQEGWLSFNEQVFVPSSITFAAGKRYIFEYEQKYPKEEMLIKTLLRTYEGIFDFPVFISEFLIARLCGIHVDDVKTGLIRLHQQGIIHYEPQKDTPQVYMLRDRVRTEEFTINSREYEKRKKRFVDRIRQMIAFVKNEDLCRSRIIGNYFGDAQLKDCGICDNCLRKKKSSISSEEFKQLQEKIHNAIQPNGIHTKELMDKLAGISKEKAWNMIEFLQSEKIIELDGKGWIRRVGGSG